MWWRRLLPAAISIGLIAWLASRISLTGVAQAVAVLPDGKILAAGRRRATEIGALPIGRAHSWWREVGRGHRDVVEGDRRSGALVV